MFITTSRKSNILAKRFSKYLSKYLPGIEFIPRGKTPLFKFFEKAKYLGHQYFLESSFSQRNVILSIYVFKDNTFLLEREYLLEIIDLRHLKNFSYIESINKTICDSKKVFYFLPKKNLSLKSKYIVSFDSENIFSFFENEDFLGFKFKILNVTKFD